MSNISVNHGHTTFLAKPRDSELVEVTRKYNDSVRILMSDGIYPA